MSRYTPQGTAVGPPPMPNKSSRSPDRHRRPSPGYERDAEWHRFQEWQKRNRKSPPRSSPSRSPPRRPPTSPRKEDWGRRSPPRSYPPDWGRRSRSPPPSWVRRSPPRYGPPRGRSPTRGRSPPRWGPPPPEWDRYRNYPPRRSPPRYGPPPPQWDTRGQRYPPPPQERGRWQPAGPPADKPSLTRPNGAPAPAPVNSEIRPSPEAGKMDDGSGDDDGLESYDVPDYDAEVPLGQKYVIAVSGFFCKICHKFYNSESSAKVTHCKSKTHYDKFAKWVSDKKEEAIAQKRSLPQEPAAAAVPTPVPAPVSTTAKQDDEPPPAKVQKVETMETEEASTSEENFGTGLVVKEEVHDESDSEQPSKQYDPLDPTTEETPVPKESKEDMNASVSEASDAEKLTTDGDITEATLYNFRKMRVQQLKENLKKRNLPIHGLKPLLLKRLEKALLAEAADAAAAESEEEESKGQQDETEESKPEGSLEVKEEEEPQAEDTDQESKTEGGEPEPAEVTLTMHESDIEVSNKKTQWITERELERELLQLPEVDKILSMEKQETKMGKKTIAEWTIKISYKGEFPSDGLSFSILSHQQLPFRASLSED